MLDQTAIDLIHRFPLGFVATLNEEGYPAVSPKGTFLVLDNQTLGFANIRSPGTVKNLIRFPHVEINFIDVFLRKGIRVRGRCRILERTDGEFNKLFPQWEAEWPALAPRIKSLVRVSLSHSSHVSTPPYDDGASEEEMVALMKEKFAQIYP